MSDILWVAEIGSNHKGDKSLAFELIRQAKESGATIAKFQFGRQELIDGKPNFKYVDDWADDLAKWCDYFGIELMASIWSLDGLETARRVGMKRYKIAYQMQGNVELISAAKADGREMFISGYDIWCVSKYPAYPSDIADMPRYFEPSCWMGYSDHCHGISACLLAVARGALYVEKHFCLDKTDLAVRDTPFSATPQEFEQMVKLGNGIRRLLNVQA
jgi:N,N'-diacetyllegionaminate synthase